MRFATFAVLAFLPGPALLAQDAGGPPASVAVSEVRTSATVTRAVPADLAVAVFEFAGRAPTLREAAQTAATLGNAIRKALVAVGVQSDSLTSRGFLTYTWDERTQVEVRPNPLTPYRPDTTYVFRDIIVARMHDLRRVGRALDTAIAAGAQKLTSLKFAATDVAKINEEVLAEASQLVRRKADIMARAAGGRLGRLIALSTDAPTESTRSEIVMRDGAVGNAMQLAATTVTAPQLEIRITVYSRWEFLSAQPPN